MKSLIILTWGGVLCIIIEFFAFLYFLSELNTRTGIQGLLALVLWVSGLWVFQFAEKLSDEFAKSSFVEKEYAEWTDNA